jgi:uncharacterized membrane protein
MAALIGLLAGALAGHAVWREWGAIFGGFVGFFVGVALSGARQRAQNRKPDALSGKLHGSAPTSRERALEARVAELEAQVAGKAREAEPASSLAPETAPAEPALPLAPDTARVEHAWQSGVDAPRVEPAAQPVSQPPRAEPHATDAPPVRPASPLAAGWAWFIGGNALTRIGVVVLFFGVAFLLRWFAEHFTLPIEVRLAAVALVGAALIAIGLSTARTRPGYGLSLQGAGAGVLYLTTYAAFRLYAVLPDEVALGALLAIAVLTVWLATRADSQPLAALAIAGGFLAPLLMSTYGEPLPLFASFAIFNGAIFALAWRHSWRALNALGFVCTLVLGLVWGHRYYTAEHFAIVLPFLVLFVAYYIAIAVLEARRGPFDVRAPIDGLLVFGVPIAAFPLQVALVRGFEYGAAWSAVALACVYATLGLVLRRSENAGLALIAKAFLALAVIFATLAIPLAFDDRLTAALWAVEAAGVYWLGIRQQAPPIRAFALLVELGAGLAFLGSGAWQARMPFAGDATMFANADFSGAMLIALSALATAWQADRAGLALPPRERPLTLLAFGWGAAWWIAAGVLELNRQFPSAEAPHAALIWIAGSAGLALALRGPLRWPRLAMIGAVLLPAMGYVALRDYQTARTTLLHYGWLIWPAAWVTQWLALAAADALASSDDSIQRGPPGIDGALRVAHSASALALTAQLSWEASEWVSRVTPAHTVWVACAAALPAIASLWLVTRFARAATWPFDRHSDAYAQGAGRALAAVVALWFVAVNVLSPGDASPLPYVPILNPLDVMLIAALAVLFYWAGRHATLDARTLHAWLGAGVFLAGNGIVLRVAHHYGDIPWRLTSLLASKPLQAALTLTWTVLGVALMYVATRRCVRAPWMVGAALLVAVVVKLFVIDLGALSGLTRVVAFLGVGVLLLAIGYLSPLPPPAGDVGDDSAR